MNTDPLTNPRNVLFATLGLLAIILLGYLASTVGVLVAILFSLAFIVGVALIPLTAWVIGPSLPGVLGEMLATTLLAPVFLGLQKVVLNQKEDDTYEVVPASAADLDEAGAWGKLAFTQVGISYDPSEDAFQSPTPPRGIDELEEEGRLPDGSPLASADLSRHGEWFVELVGDAVTDGGETVTQFRVPIGQSLSRLRGAAGTALGEEAIEEALKKYGGNSSWGGSGTTLIYVLDIVLLLIGLGAGYILFM